MKRRLTGIIALILLSVYCVFTLTACGCAGEQPISFNNRFTKGYGDGVPNDYFEELVYEINYKDDMYGYNISSALSPENFDFGVGSYVTTLKRLDVAPEELKNNEVLTSSNDKFYSYKTSFSMPVTYYIDGVAKSFVDTIESIVYFHSQNMSFAPIYSNTKAHYSVYSAVEGGYNVQDVLYESTFTYDKNSYTLTLSGEGFETSTTTHDYEFKTLVDNAQLLFALRNLEVKENAPRNLFVSSSAYKEQTDIAVYFEKAVTERAENLAVNGTEFTEDVKLDMIRFRVNSAKKSGNEQYLFIQNEESAGNIPNNAYIFKYVQPLICYGSFEFIGSLEFSLISVNKA